MDSVPNMDYIKKCLVFAKFVAICIILTALVFIIVHNIIAPDEKDISKETIKTLVSLIPAAVGAVKEGINISLEEEWQTQNKYELS